MAEKRTITEHILPELRKILKENDFEMPSTRELSSSLKVSRTTIQKALKVLSENGEIIRFPKKKAQIAKYPDRGKAFNPQKELFQYIRSEIFHGSYPTGSALPKIDFFRMEFGVSRYKVQKVYLQLVDSGLAWKSGNRVIVGPPISVLKRSPINPQTILVIAGYSWYGFYNSERTGSFSHFFARECERHFVRIKVIQKNDFSGNEGWNGLFNAIKKTVQKLGDRHIGSLIFGEPDTFPLFNILEQLQKTGKPAIWLDKNDHKIPPELSRRKWIHCLSAEHKAVEAAVKYLKSHGHFNVGYIITQDVQWQIRRGDILKSICQKKGIGLHINKLIIQWCKQDGNKDLIPVFKLLKKNCSYRTKLMLSLFSSLKPKYEDFLDSKCPENLADSPFQTLFGAILVHLTENNLLPEKLSNFIQVIWAAAAMEPLINKFNTTAIVAANDRNAKWLHRHWLNDLKLKAPEDVSLISFDNSDRAFLRPLSTVDFGFDSLGIQVFQVLFGSAPTVFQSSTIMAEPRVIERGSVGPAKKI